MSDVYEAELITHKPMGIHREKLDKQHQAALNRLCREELLQMIEHESYGVVKPY
jgi:hypothetical protein